MSKTPKRNLTMLSVEKGQLLKIGTAGEEIKGMVIEVDEQKVCLVYSNKITQVDRNKIETVRPYTPPGVAFALVLAVVLFSGLVGFGVKIGYEIWG